MTDHAMLAGRMASVKANAIISKIGSVDLPREKEKIILKRRYKMNFIYATKAKSGCAGASALVDVSVTYSGKDKDDIKILRFSFSCSIVEKAFKKVTHLTPAIDKDQPTRIYFLVDDVHGYRLCDAKKNGGTRRYLSPYSLTLLINNPESFIGDYDLNYDPICEMWFIDSTKKIKIKEI